ncbi:uncharacterized protein LOC118192650 isoform X2 [Stegodyphus dumicola]|uniref:uncharacterized protein LOC118192650 isoform X2 n=1 Tax=Stegodyphus dumicola TaxID=202533 RepID=UPI0015AA61C5|nr:uncharacterized protein LOC118192650 isoform X2 [Stegodyphus dumicola]XP_035219535.1 uncharacterized protein LOC118192650 isoform X2 [Stegodyphus dumicola]
MASDFYQRTAALCEEFEKSQHSENIILQDTLRKINRREKETEETYKNLMKQLGELDQRIELMSFKLDKLNVLKDSVTSTRLSSWPESEDTFERNLKFYQSSSAFLKSPVGFGLSLFNSDFQTASTNSNYQIISKSPNLQTVSGNPNYQTVSTQTDLHILCGHCHFPVSIKQNFSRIQNIDYESEIQNANERANFVPSVAAENYNIVSQELLQNSQMKAQENSAFNQPVSGFIVTDHRLFETSENSSILFNKNSFLSENIPNTLKLNDSHFSDTAVTIIQPKNPVETYENKNISNTEITNSEKRSLEAERSDAVVDYDTNQMAAMRSDDESINHEFDFLENSKNNYTKLDSAQNLKAINDSMVKTVQQEEQHHAPYQQDSSTAEGIAYSDQDIAESKKTGNKKHPDIKNFMKDKNNDIKSDSSLSAGELHSPSVQSENMSAGSESDSFYEKESPLTATAAYQALLGNVAAVEKVIKTPVISDSESEDDVEHALATAVRKTSSVQPVVTSVVQREEKRDNVPHVEHETSRRASKSATVSKPQSKLSKSTRKVLGLDTSSGSEMEIEAKVPKNNDVDDDDEFDFYD